MTVKIPISADPAQGVAAFNQIASAIRKAGQEGRKFSELDFSHKELKPFEEDIKRVQANFEELKKVGRGATAASVRKGGYNDAMEWYKGHSRQFPDQKQRQNHQDSVSNYVSQGTRWAGSGSPREGGEGGGGKGGGGFGLGSFIPGIGKLLGIGLGLAGIGKVTSMLSSGVTSATDEAVQLDTFKRMINDTSTEFGDLRSSLREVSSGLQLTYNETVKLAQSFVKASAYSNAERVNKEVHSAAGFARSFGLNPNQVTQMFGQARWLKAGGGKDTSPKEMALMFADAISSGNMWGKADEVVSAIIGWTQQAERTMIDAPNVKRYAALSSAMNKSGRPGFRGQAGAALISQMDSSIRNGGHAGDAGQNFLWRALSPNGEMNPWQMRMKREEGMFGTLDDGRSTMEATMQLAKKMYPNRLQRADALSRFYGTSMHGMLDIMDLKRGSYGKLSAMIKKYKIDPTAINATSFQGLADVATADNSGLERLRTSALKRSDLSEVQEKVVEGAAPGEALRETLAKTLAVVGREKTTGLKVQDAVTAMQNALTNTGSNLLAPIYSIKGFLAQMVKSPIDTTLDAEQGLSNAIMGYVKRPTGHSGPGIQFNNEGVPIQQVHVMRGRKRPTGHSGPGIQFNNEGVPIQQVHVKIDHAPLKVEHVDSQGRHIRGETMPPALVTQTE